MRGEFPHRGSALGAPRRHHRTGSTQRAAVQHRRRGGRVCVRQRLLRPAGSVRSQGRRLGEEAPLQVVEEDQRRHVRPRLHRGAQEDPSTPHQPTTRFVPGPGLRPCVEHQQCTGDGQEL